ncbi:phosphoethanolamine--lipid A transferase EptA [Herbaspirillum aquaticum]|uniref:phosphoethanolamine--lipid A transferase EptA n=1 Tax=Herbaspirillum aquaticum TaxID=568783 RepID=UPI0024DEE423|nr:phosphoethanolamine--lipid A transferase EptA [Herbaspirillum aquaticum]
MKNEQVSKDLNPSGILSRKALVAISNPKLTLLQFLLVIGIINSVLFQGPAFKYAVANLDLRTNGAWLTLSTVFAIQFSLTLWILTAVAIVSARAAKVVCIILFIGNSIALYFINSFGVIIDKTMIGNAFNTNASEASAFLHFGLLVYVVFLGIVPSILIARTRIQRMSKTRLATFLVMAMLLGLGWIYSNAKSWLWIDKHARQMGSLLLPWSYAVNSVRYVSDASSVSKVQLELPRAHFSDPHEAVIVLVIGESARAANFSLYGYQKLTNPLMAKAGVIVMPNASSCATYTTEGLRCILSYLGSRTPARDNHEPLTSYLQRNGVEVTWRSNNWGEPSMKVARFEKAADIRQQCQGGACANLDRDELLLYGLEKIMRSSVAKKKFIVLHQNGSHGPLYFSKYSLEFEEFKPVCRTVELDKCSNEELFNAYDNSILYTDYFLNRVVSMLKSLSGTPAAMIYVSDHGESLGEYGLYLHGTPYSIAPDVQKKIPFIVWTSDNFPRRESLLAGISRNKTGYSQDYVFHSVLGALGMTSDIYNPNLDIFGSPSWKTP